MGEQHPALEDPTQSDDIDVLREVLNVGVGAAAATLSELTGFRVTMHVPDLRILPAEQILAFASEEIPDLAVCVSQSFQGSVTGKAVLLYSRDSSDSLLHAVCGPVVPVASLSGAALATLQEIGNMVLGSCLSALSDVIEGRLRLTVPEVDIATTDLYFRNALCELRDAAKAVVFRNQISVRDLLIETVLVVMLGFSDFEVVVERARVTWTRQGRS